MLAEQISGILWSISEAVCSGEKITVPTEKISNLNVVEVFKKLPSYCLNDVLNAIELFYELLPHIIHVQSGLQEV